MFPNRYGYLEEAFMTFWSWPIRFDSGEVGAILSPDNRNYCLGPQCAPHAEPARLQKGYPHY
jgi:hypothetical protein